MDRKQPLGGLDPAELLRQGAVEDTFAEGMSASPSLPSLEEIAAAFPQFEILGLIGHGGMGAVYKVRQKDLDRIVALKILPLVIGCSPEFSERFTHEAKALAKLNHPGIVTIHEFGQREGLHYILMEFVDGVNLAQLMESGRVSPREALAIVPQICDALQFAHDLGIVHRDIKPENILLDRKGRVKVADFGIAKVIASCDPAEGAGMTTSGNHTLAGNIIGTPQYMAPEQIESPSEVDHRADIYALGVVLYQMLTGELPDKDLQAPSRKLHIDVRLDEIVLQALERNPNLRYQSAGEFRTRVETVVTAGKVPETVCETPSRRARAKVVRWVIHLLWAASTAGLVALAITFLSEVLTKERGNLDQSMMTWEDVYGPVITVLLGCGLLAIPIKAFRFSSARVWIGAILATASIAAITYVLAAPVEDTAFHADNFIVAVAVCAFGAFLFGFAAVFGMSDTSTCQPSGHTRSPRGLSRLFRTSAVGCGMLAFLPVILVVGIYAEIYLRKRGVEEREQELMLATRAEVAAAEKREKRLEKDEIASRAILSVWNTKGKRLSRYDWEILASEGRVDAERLELANGTTCLKIENPAGSPMDASLLTIENPPITEKRYALWGVVHYENVEGEAYLETWNVFPEGRFFSRANQPGNLPMSGLSGKSGSRIFILPFDREGTKGPPDRIELNLHLPGKGTVFLGPLELVELAPGENARGSQADAPAGIGRADRIVTVAAEAWLAAVDAGDYGRSWKEASGYFRKSITEAGWAEAMTKLRQPLGRMKSRKLVGRQNAELLPGAPHGKYVVLQFESSFSHKAKALETVTFALEEDGSWKAAGYFIR